MAQRMKTAGKRPAKRTSATGTSKPGSSKNAARSRARKMRQSPKRRPPSPLERAQGLVDKASLAVDPERQFELIQRALELSPDCADAFTMLSRFVADRRQALILLEQGWHAAERVLGPDKIHSLAGKFWRARETRPYMRARLELSECQWALGLRDQSVEHLLGMLRLNPADDQGVRYLLSAHLLELNRDAQFDALVREFDESTTFLLFAKVLREFRRSGDSSEAHQLLARAMRCNRFVVPLLLQGDVHDHSPASYSPGRRSEAEMYVSNLAHAWKQTPGAITWLRQANSRKPVTAKRKPFQEPSAAIRKQLLRVTQVYGSIWQAAISRLETWLRDGAQMVRPWSILIVDHTNHKVLGQEVLTQEPDAEELFECLARSILKPAWGKAHRPSEIQVRDEPIWNKVQPGLQEIGIDCIYRPELEETDYLLSEMQGVMRPRQPPGLSEIENFHSSQGASFYEAVAEYFRRTPWQRVPSDAVIQVDCPQLAEFDSSRWFAVVLGQAGQTLGLALHSQLSDLQSICGGCCSREEAKLTGSTLSMLYSEAFEIPISDMLAAEKHHWPLAGPEEYPLVMCVEAAGQPRTVATWELQLLEGCVRALPDFVERHPFIAGNTGGPATMTSAGLKFHLSWLESDAGTCQAQCGDCDGCDETCE